VGPPTRQRRKPIVDPVPDSAFDDTVEARNFLDGVAAMNLGPPRVEGALAGHGSRRSVIDELANVLDAPRCNAPPEFDRGRIPTIADTLPPCRLADGDKSLRADNLLQA